MHLCRSYFLIYARINLSNLFPPWLFRSSKARKRSQNMPSTETPKYRLVYKSEFIFQNENVSRDEVGRLEKPLGLFFVIYNFLWTNVTGKSYGFSGFGLWYSKIKSVKIISTFYVEEKKRWLCYFESGDLLNNCANTTRNVFNGAWVGELCSLINGIMCCRR